MSASREDQYKKKFQEWYKDEILLPKNKKRRREGTPRGPSKRIKAASSLKDGCITPWSPRRREKSATTPLADQVGVKEEDKQLITLEERIEKLSFSHLPQQEYMQQLENLWDVHFDAEFGKAALIDVQDAVESMIDFLVTISFTDPGMSTVATRPGDRGLLHLVSARIWRRYPKDDWLCEGLSYVTAVVPLTTEQED